MLLGETAEAVDEEEEADEEIVDLPGVRDEELVAMIKEGDPRALEMLIKAYMGRTYRKVRLLVPIDDVEDVTQDIMINLIKSIDNFKGRSAFATWFNKIIINRVADYHRRTFKTKARFLHTEDMAEGWEPSQDPDYRYDDDYEARELLTVLPERYSEVIIMKFYFNLSFTEIASALGLNYEAARSRYRRAIKCARRRIDPDLLRKYR